eukprot:scaffold374377_cov31-Attheya_sp.AAC.2
MSPSFCHDSMSALRSYKKRLVGIKPRVRSTAVSASYVFFNVPCLLRLVEIALLLGKYSTWTGASAWTAPPAN